MSRGLKALLLAVGLVLLWLQCSLANRILSLLAASLLVRCHLNSSEVRIPSKLVPRSGVYLWQLKMMTIYVLVVSCLGEKFLF